MISIFEHEGKVTAQDTFDQAVEKVRNAIKGQINKVYPFSNYFVRCPRGRHHFEDGTQKC